MEESATAALSLHPLARRGAEDRSRVLRQPRHRPHVHLPAGAMPKDGPSAGVALCTALVSLLSHRKGAVGNRDDRRDHAPPVTCSRSGGIKEKVLGAHRAGIKSHRAAPGQPERPRGGPRSRRAPRADLRAGDASEQVLELALDPEPEPRRSARIARGEAMAKPDGQRGDGRTPPREGEGAGDRLPAADRSIAVNRRLRQGRRRESPHSHALVHASADASPAQSKLPTLAGAPPRRPVRGLRHGGVGSPPTVSDVTPGRGSTPRSRRWSAAPRASMPRSRAPW